MNKKSPESYEKAYQRSILDPEGFWSEKHLNVPVIDRWWQTETGGPLQQTAWESAHFL